MSLKNLMKLNCLKNQLDLIFLKHLLYQLSPKCLLYLS
jgi:hypothetical protein